jgi:hypothetical protein
MLRNRKYVYLITSMLFSTSIFASTLPNVEIEDMPRLKSHYNQKVDSALLALNAKKYKKAYRKLSNTARWGHKESQFYLATMYLQGQGTTQDIPKAWIWLNLALEQRNTDWIIMKRRLAQHIPEDAQLMLDKEIEIYRNKYGASARGLSCRATKVVGSNRQEERCEHKWVN